jgi:hypothetical protein
VVEGDGGDEVVADVSTNDVVEEMGVNEAKVTVNGGGGTASKAPGAVAVVGKGSVGVLEESDGNYRKKSVYGSEW